MSESTFAVSTLVLCADDYALHASASAGILALARQGRISATSVMTLSPRWTQDAPALRELQGHIDVGLHLDWTSPFAQNAGYGQSVGAMMVRSVFDAAGLVPAPQAQARVREVVQRQLDAFEAHWHRAPDHVDGHQHVHQFASIREPLLEVLQQRYGATQRPWLRISQVGPAQEAGLKGLGGFKGRIISALGAKALTQWAQAAQWPHVAPLLGVYDFKADEGVYAQHMAQWLRVVPACSSGAGAVMMCHPAQASDAVSRDVDAAQDGIYAARLREFAYLQSDAFAQALQTAQVRLGRGTVS